MMEVVGLVLTLLSLLGSASSLTFYGGSLHFKPLQRNEDGTFRVTFYGRQNGRSSCQDESSFSCEDGACSSLRKFRVLQTDRDDPTRGHWCQSEGRSTATVRRTSRTLALTDSGCCWVSNVGGLSSWTSRAELDLGTRSDSRSINRCPVTTTTSSLRFPQNCFSRLRLLAHDPDGDEVRCRHANETEAPSNFTLDEGCTISSSGEVQTGVYVFDVMMEDFPVSNLTLTYGDGSSVPSDSTPLCSVKLQFAVNILPSVPGCELGQTPPIFLSGTPSHGQVLHAAAGQTFRLHARAQAAGASVEDFQVSGPQNATKEVKADGAGRAEMTLSWTPQREDLDRDVPVCFSAQTNETQSEMRCVVVTVTEASTEQGKASVVCAQGKMLVVLEKASMPGIDVNFLKLQDPKCSLTSNSSHIMGVMSLHTCGTTVEDKGDFIVFKNEITSFELASAVITRRKTIKIEFSCQFPKTLSVSSSYDLHASDYVFTESAFGSFGYAFEVFRDGNFTDRVAPDEYPVAVQLMEKIYMGIEAKSELPSVKLFVESCRATPDDNPENSMTYDLIKDGCTKDETLQVHSSSSSTSFNFEVQAFKFTGDFQQVYITCTVILCEADSAVSRCARGCLKDPSRRRRRSLDRETQGHYITQGPLQFVQRDNRGQGGLAGRHGNVAQAQMRTSDSRGDDSGSRGDDSGNRGDDSGNRGDVRASSGDGPGFRALLSSNITTVVFASAFLVAVATLAVMVRYYRKTKTTDDTNALIVEDDEQS